MAEPGALDPGFGSGGMVVTNVGTGADSATGIAIQPDGKIVLAGTSRGAVDLDFAVVRYTTTGALDPGFNSSGKAITPVGLSDDYAAGVALQSDGKIVVAGYANTGVKYDFVVVRYTSTGALDSSFSTDGKASAALGMLNDHATAVALQPDGKIVVVGYANNTGKYDFAIARFTSSGALDTSFGGDGRVTTSIGAVDDRAFAVAIQPDGKIVVAGRSHNGIQNAFAIVRYTSTGALDTGFSGDGIATTAIANFNDRASAVRIQPDGRIVVAGTSHNGTNDDFAIARYTSSGALDVSFSGDGKATTAIGASHDVANALALQANGRIVVAGASHNGFNNDFAAARYTSAGVLDATFNGTGKLITALGALHDAAAVAIQPIDGKIILGGTRDDGAGEDFAAARYLGDEYVLAIDATLGAASGRVTSDSPGVECDGQCQFLVPFGATIELSAVADAGATFAGWSGACAGIGTCSVTVDVPQVDVGAAFAPGLPPEAPTGVSAVSEGTDIRIAWSSVGGATGYNVYMANAPGVTRTNYLSLPGGHVHSNATSPYLHPAAVIDLPYYVVVTAVGAFGESAESAEVPVIRRSHARNDLDGNGRSDILWRHAAGGQNIVWFMNAATREQASALSTVDTSWSVAGTGDMNADGRSDLLWRNSSTGQNAVWLMDGATRLASAFLSSVAGSWEVIAVADFNGDGKADILWRNSTTGQNVLWFMNGTVRASVGFPSSVADTNWKVVGVGDTDGDGKADLVWRNESTGQNIVWRMDGAARLSATFLSTVADANWAIVSVADFDGDGRADILWRHAVSGQNIMWLMNGGVRSSWGSLSTVANAWAIAATGDYNGDGKADILWRNETSGQNVEWLMNGTVRLAARFLSTVPDANWKVVP